MSEEEKTIETISKNKKDINIWKILFIVLISISLVYFAYSKIYDSDYYINKTLSIKKADNVEVGKNIKMNYTSKYDGGLLKMNIALINIDKKVLDMAKKWLSDDDNVMEIVFSDKDSFKLTSKHIVLKDLIMNRDKEGTYDVQLALSVDKNTVRKIKYIHTSYITALDMSYKDFMKELKSKL